LSGFVTAESECGIYEARPSIVASGEHAHGSKGWDPSFVDLVEVVERSMRVGDQTRTFATDEPAQEETRFLNVLE